MYVPAHFAARDEDVHHLLAHHGAADLITNNDGHLETTVVPFVYDDTDGSHGALLGHIAKANRHWRAPVVGEALVIVRGPDAYVSPSWYATKAETHRVVPTWNYLTANVRGVVTWHEDPAWIEAVVRRLTDKHEGALGSDVPWSVEDAPPDFIASKLKAVVGVKVAITSIEAKAKMSQNRSDADVDGVIAGIEATGDTDAAAAVRAANRDQG